MSYGYHSTSKLKLKVKKLEGFFLFGLSRARGWIRRKNQGKAVSELDLE